MKLPPVVIVTWYPFTPTLRSLHILGSHLSRTLPLYMLTLVVFCLIQTVMLEGPI